MWRRSCGKKHMGPTSAKVVDVLVLPFPEAATPSIAELALVEMATGIE